MKSVDDRVLREQGFYAKAVELRPVLAADEGLLRRIASTFRHQYGSPPRPALCPGTRELGRGTYHVIYGVGSMRDPSDGSELWLALRMPKLCPYTLDERLAGEIALFEGAYGEGERTPRFCVAASYGRKAAILTEDVSRGAAHRLQAIDAERVRRDDGEIFFIDPDEELTRPSGTGMRYLENAARIDVPQGHEEESR